MLDRIRRLIVPVLVIVVGLSATFLLLNKAFNWIDFDPIIVDEDSSTTTTKTSTSTSATATSTSTSAATSA